MKFLIVALAFACAQARPDVSHLSHEVPIIRNDFDLNPDGSYQYSYETGNGISAEAQGVVKNPNSENPALEIQGRVSYTSPEGEPVFLTYVANEAGYQPQGSHIPVPPPTPEAILRSLDWIAAHPPQAAASARGPVGGSRLQYTATLLG